MFSYEIAYRPSSVGISLSNRFHPIRASPFVQGRIAASPSDKDRSRRANSRGRVGVLDKAVQLDGVI
jgi:hypothetical protein